MKLALNTVTIQPAPLFDKIVATSKAGFEGIEFHVYEILDYLVDRLRFIIVIGVVVTHSQSPYDRNLLIDSPIETCRPVPSVTEYKLVNVTYCFYLIAVI